MKNNYQYSELTSEIIKSFYNVYNNLGYGFLEKVYEKSLLIELRKSGLLCNAQVPIKVYYELQEVGYYFADIVVNNCIIIEVKAVETFCEEHEAQILNYLKATEFELGMLLNFGKKAQFKRKVFSSQYKKSTLSKPVVNHKISS